MIMCYNNIRKREEQISQRKKEVKTMRTITYAVINKETNKKVYTNISHRKCEEYIKKNGNANLVIGYKWISI